MADPSSTGVELVAHGIEVRDIGTAEVSYIVNLQSKAGAYGASHKHGYANLS